MMSMFTHFDNAYGEGYYSGIPSGDGATDVFHNGSVVEHYHPQPSAVEHGDIVMHVDNAYGGEDTIVNGKTVQSTHANLYGGEDVYQDGQLHQMTVANAHGGVDIYDSNMHMDGMTMPNLYGGEDYLSLHGNADTMLSYQDPLIHSSEYHMNPFDVTGTRI